MFNQIYETFAPHFSKVLSPHFFFILSSLFGTPILCMLAYLTVTQVLGALLILKTKLFILEQFLGLQKSCKDSTESPHVVHMIFPTVVILYWYGTSCTKDLL